MSSLHCSEGVCYLIPSRARKEAVFDNPKKIRSLTVAARMPAPLLTRPLSQDRHPKPPGASLWEPVVRDKPGVAPNRRLGHMYQACRCKVVFPKQILKKTCIHRFIVARCNGSTSPMEGFLFTARETLGSVAFRQETAAASIVTVHFAPPPSAMITSPGRSVRAAAWTSARKPICSSQRA